MLVIAISLNYLNLIVVVLKLKVAIRNEAYIVLIKYVKTKLYPIGEIRFSNLSVGLPRRNVLNLISKNISSVRIFDII